MAFSVAALIADGPCTVEGAEAASRVFPRIFRYTTSSRGVNLRWPVADLSLEGLVHDLNNVFQTIAESADVLGNDPKWEKLARTLQRSVDRGQRIAHSILETNRSATELIPVIENAAQFCQDYLECANRPKIGFARRYRSRVPAQGRSGAWERVLVNLLFELGASRCQEYPHPGPRPSDRGERRRSGNRS